MRVLTVGHCDFDHGNLTRWLQRHFEVEVDRAHGEADALEVLQRENVALVLVNRLMDRDGGAGIDIIRRIKHEAPTRHVPVMLISNFAEAQQAAVQAGALPGFGKAELEDPGLPRRLATALSPSGVRA